MYIMEITDVAGKEDWFPEPGWYFTDELFQFQGPFVTELLAVEAYAWHVNEIFDRIIQIKKAVESPNLIIPDKRLIQ